MADFPTLSIGPKTVTGPTPIANVILSETEGGPDIARLRSTKQLYTFQVAYEAMQDEDLALLIGDSASDSDAGGFYLTVGRWGTFNWTYRDIVYSVRFTDFNVQRSDNILRGAMVSFSLKTV